MFLRRCTRLHTASCSPIGTGALRFADGKSWRLAQAASWAPVRSYSAEVTPDDGDSKASKESNGKASTSTGSKNLLDTTMKPSEVVAELDRHIVGQHDAKRAVAIAMRNRWRRRQLPEDLRKEVTPRNVLLVGPTGTSTLLNRGLCRGPDCPSQRRSHAVVRRMREDGSCEADGPAERRSIHQS